MSQVRILNINFDLVGFSDLVVSGMGVIVPVNVDMLVKAQNHSEFWRVIQSADWVICDSQVLRLMCGLILRLPVPSKISGSDFFPALCKARCFDPDFRVFLLGAAPGVAEKARKNINKDCGAEVITRSYSPSYGFENDHEECHRIIDAINKSGCTVLAIGVGAPKQELWIARYRNLLTNVHTFLPVGATIDFQAGVVSRSPSFISNLGLEWLYRLLLEPRRLFRRYLVDDLVIFPLLVRQRLGRYENPHE